MKKIVLFMLLHTFLIMEISAQEKYNADVNIRQRFELSDKSFLSKDKAAGVNVLRSRLGLTFKASENVTAYAQLQDSRGFGTEMSPLTDGSADAFDLHQGFILVNNFFDLPLSMKLGRQEVAFGNERLIGAVGWHNIGQSFDGVRFTAMPGFGSIDVFNFKVSESSAQGDAGDKNLIGVWANLNNISESVKPQVYVLLDKIIGPGRQNLFTIGTQTDATFNTVSISAEYAMQLGNHDANTDISANMFALNGTVDLSPFKLMGGVDYLSGQDQSNKRTIFNTLYATNHKFYGYMDYFLNIPLHTSGLGLTDIHVKAAYKISEKVNSLMAVHILNSSEDNVNGDSTFGKEVDIILNYAYGDGLGFECGAGYFLPGDLFFTEENGFWAYFQTNFALK
jgi:hypothetical protein